MHIRLRETPGWRWVATVEMPASTTEFPQLIRDDSLQFEVRLAEKSPRGYLWYEIFIDPTVGERRLARTAWALLSRFKSSADAGFLESLRIVCGQHWLTMGDDTAGMRVDGMTSGESGDLSSAHQPKMAPQGLSFGQFASRQEAHHCARG